MPVRFPAEWEPHASTWLAWPHDELTFPHLESVERIWAEMIAEIAKGEKVNLLAHSRLLFHVESHLTGMKNVSIHNIPTADVWLRDTGPIFVKDGRKLKATCWRFNAWGEKYENLMADAGLNEKIAAIASVPPVKTGMVLEGGSIETNGAGLCLTSEQCLLNKNRNPSLSRLQIEANLKRRLGFRQILWLGEGIEGDDTDGHIDDIARFVSEKAVVYAMPGEKGDPNFAVLTKNEGLLKKYARTHKLKLQPLPMPPLLESDDDKSPLPASHCNFYICNAAVLVPVFKGKSDKEAISILKESFPGRKVIGIDCRHVIDGFGALHCVTQQQPK